MNKSDIRSLICTTFSDLKNNINRGAKVVNCLDAKNHMCPFSEYGGMLRACEKEIAVAEKDLLEKLEKAFGCTISCDGLRDLEQRVEKLEPKKQCPRICPFNNPYKEKSEEDVPCDDPMFVAGKGIERDPGSTTPTGIGRDILCGCYTIHPGIVFERSDLQTIVIDNAEVQVLGSLGHANIKHADVEVISSGKSWNLTLFESESNLSYKWGGHGSAVVVRDGTVHVTNSGTQLVDVVLYGGKLNVTKGAKVFSGILNEKGSAYISSAEANILRINSGASCILNAATAFNVEITHGGFMRLSSAKVSNCQVRGGQLRLADQSSATGLWIGNNGYVQVDRPSSVITSLTMSKGNVHAEYASIQSATLHSGAELFCSGGDLQKFHLLDSAHIRVVGSGAVVSGIIDGGKMEILPHGGGLLRREGPTARSMSVISCGQLVIGGSAVMKEARVATGGELYIWSRGYVQDLVIESGGTVVVSSGGLLENCRVDSGGKLIVQSGGFAKMDLNGGILEGSMHGNVCQYEYQKGKTDGDGWR